MNTIFITSSGSVFNQPNKGCMQGGCENSATTIINLDWPCMPSYVCDEHKQEWITWYLSHLPSNSK